MTIHPTAIISEGAQLGAKVRIGPFTVIGPHVIIGSGTTIGGHAVIEGHTTIGADCRISHHVVIGTAPQDLKYKGEPTRLEIGDRNDIREFATINIGTATGTGLTRVGSDNLLMAYTHIAHDCRVGDHVILSNAVTLAGHVAIQDHATVGGLSAFHQFSRMGAFAFVGGCSAVSQDVPPFSLVAGNHAVLRGINVVGLRRNGFDEETITAVKKAIHLLRSREFDHAQVLAQLEDQLGRFDAVQRLITFVKETRRGICKG
ncbi:acyl-ACP--UDP-N-acetylglucosamine O-acyltransferase [bacterium]|nr:acyl-ACP--UDP-N-acetylglucosamine O-acyltransferase [candidate division CSSED10-310 bacterium]